jgi:hypothetical protein
MILFLIFAILSSVVKCQEEKRMILEPHECYSIKEYLPRTPDTNFIEEEE